MPWNVEDIPKPVKKFFTMMNVHQDIRTLVEQGNINQALDLARTRSAKVSLESQKILQIASAAAMKKGIHVTASEYMHVRALRLTEKRPRRK